MSDQPTVRFNPETQRSSGPIDEICQQFESEWRAGRNPRIEDFLSEWEEPELSKLLSELLLVELNLAAADGHTLAPAAYEVRFGDHREVVREAFERWSAAPRSLTQADSDAETIVMRTGLAGLHRHAEGGLGVVYRAFDQDLRREVAVKYLRDKLEEDEDCRNRMRVEAEITGRLEHPGIVPVYGCDVDADGRLFYVMRFIAGETLDAMIKRFHESRQTGSHLTREHDSMFRELLSRFVDVCNTLAYAHNRGILHRDIKPENVMLGRYGETIVIDWGLAVPIGRAGVFKQSGEKTLTPSSGSQSSARGGVAGTPAYMSPEQASGSDALTPASDIYGLGAMLYKLLVGQPAFSGSLNEICANVRMGRFEEPTNVDKTIPKPLEAICLKAMMVEPSRRYGTALELARDIENFLADEPVSVYRESRSLKLARWARRHRATSQALLTALVVLMLVGLAGSLVFSRLQANAVASQQRERELHIDSLKGSARFAAGTIANRVDIRLRILEQAAADPQLVELVQAVNAVQAQPDSPERHALQEWVDRYGSKYAHLKSRSWFVCGDRGWQVARHPMRYADGELYTSLSQNYAYRDYFHGLGEDAPQGSDLPPLRDPNFSLAMFSTNDGDLSIVFSVPIRTAPDSDPLGVIAMSIELGEFADLKIDLPPGQHALLVDSRTYYMKHHDRRVSGEGLVLQHRDLLAFSRTANQLPHVAPETLEHMRSVKRRWMESNGGTDNLLPETYRDPVSRQEDTEWLAAFAPVFLTARSADSQVHDSGCFVIIEQEISTDVNGESAAEDLEAGGE